MDPGKWMVRAIGGKRCPLTAAFLAPSLLGILAGCAVLGGHPGDGLLRKGDYAAAISVYEEEEAKRPNDPRIKRNLGAALLGGDRLDPARRKLKEAEALNPWDPYVFYLQGRVEDRSGMPDQALLAYSRHLALGGRNTPFLRGRVEELGTAIAAARLRRARLLETSLAESLSADPPPSNSLAITEFANLSGSETLQALSRGLAAVMISDLVKVKAFRVLERRRIQVILDELALSGLPGVPIAASEEGVAGSRQVAKPPTEQEAGAPEGAGERTASVARFAPKLGWVLQARHLVQGSILREGEARIELAAQIIEVRSDSLRKAGPPVSGALENVLPAEKKLVYQVLDSFGIRPSPEEREEIDKLPTESFLAFLSFSRGLVLEDLGDRGGSMAAHAEARRLDPGFRLARERLEILLAGEGDPKDRDRAEMEEMTREALETDMAWRIIHDIGGAPLPDMEAASAASFEDPNVGDSDDARIQDPQVTGAEALPGFPDDPWGSRKR